MTLALNSPAIPIKNRVFTAAAVFAVLLIGSATAHSQQPVLSNLYGVWNDDWDGSQVEIRQQEGRVLAVIVQEKQLHSWKSAEIKVVDGSFSMMFYSDPAATVKDNTAGTIGAKTEQDGKVLRFANQFTWTLQKKANPPVVVDATPKVEYRVTLHTFANPAAGTQANIYLQLTGSKGKSAEIHLNPLMTGTPFQPGQADTVRLSIPDIGSVAGVAIRSDMLNDDDWDLHYVGVGGQKDGGQTYDFNHRFVDTKTQVRHKSIK